MIGESRRGGGMEVGQGRWRHNRRVDSRRWRGRGRKEGDLNKVDKINEMKYRLFSESSNFSATG